MNRFQFQRDISYIVRAMTIRKTVFGKLLRNPQLTHYRWAGMVFFRVPRLTRRYVPIWPFIDRLCTLSLTFNPVRLRQLAVPNRNDQLP